MEDEPGYGHLPCQPVKLENPRYILPDLRMEKELLDVKDSLYEADNLDNPAGTVPFQSIKPEFIKVEDFPNEPLNLECPSKLQPTITVKEEWLNIKEEPDFLHPTVVYEDDSDDSNIDNKIIKLRNGSDEDLMSLSEEETVDTKIVLHNRASPDSAMHHSLNVVPSSLSDCNIPSVLQYSRDTFKNRKTSTIQSTEIQMIQELVDKNKPILQYECFNNSEKTLRCNENKRNVCDTCHKCFSTPFNLKKHRNIHTSSKPYACDTCHKCFSQLSHMKTHERIHTLSKPYICDTCHKDFSDLSNLKRHMSLHTVNKPYTCDTCHKCFNQLSNLKRHKRLHTGSKPYTCDTCHKCFSSLSNLKRHISTHRE